MGEDALQVDQLSVNLRSTGHQMSNYSSSNWWPTATAHSSRPSLFWQISSEEVSRFSLASSKALETILSAASSTTSHRPVDIQDLLGRQQQELAMMLSLKEQVAFARQEQQRRVSSMFSELLLHQQIKAEIEREAAALALTFRPASRPVQGATGSTSLMHLIRGYVDDESSMLLMSQLTSAAAPDSKLS
jgi:hypothetical protein